MHASTVRIKKRGHRVLAKDTGRQNSRALGRMANDARSKMSRKFMYIYKKKLSVCPDEVFFVPADSIKVPNCLHSVNTFFVLGFDLPGYFLSFIFPFFLPCSSFSSSSSLLCLPFCFLSFAKLKTQSFQVSSFIILSFEDSPVIGKMFIFTDTSEIRLQTRTEAL